MPATSLDCEKATLYDKRQEKTLTWNPFQQSRTIEDISPINLQSELPNGLCAEDLGESFQKGLSLLDASSIQPK